MASRYEVALDVETSRIYGRRILEGISQFLEMRWSWSIYLEQRDLDNESGGLFDHWRGDGIITRHISTGFAKQLRRRKLAVVDLSDGSPHMGFFRIGSAHWDIGRLAAKHLLETGVTSFGCCGFVSECWSTQRREGFVTGVEDAGYSCDVYESQGGSAHAWDKDQRQLSHWIMAISKPAGVFATNDVRGQHVLDACARENVAVPEEVAVIGVDNDELLCGLCNPPLSSVIPNPKQIGYEAAAWLDRIMAGNLPTLNEIVIPPLGVATRQSSDIVAVPNAEVAAALRYIRERACDGVTVDDVLEQVPVSRSWLERNFRKYLHRSPKAEIRNVQMKRCITLLTTTDLSLNQIAELTGFKHPEYLSVVFKRLMGKTPGQSRKRGSKKVPIEKGSRNQTYENRGPS
jgi:LacI family transcriptional regulator